MTSNGGLLLCGDALGLVVLCRPEVECMFKKDTKEGPLMSNSFRAEHTGDLPMPRSFAKEGSLRRVSLCSATKNWAEGQPSQKMLPIARGGVTRQ